jgi:hypothetical protein
MLNFSQLTEDQLLRQETLQAIKAEAFDLLDHLMVPESKKLADEIERKIDSLPNLKARAPEIFALLQKIIIYLRINSIMAQDNITVLDLVKNNYLDAFNCGLDWNERMTGKMYSIPDLAWPDFAQQLLSAIKQNVQLLGNQLIIISGDPQPSQPAIKNWLADYDRNLGPEKIDALHREEYLAKNLNAKKLNENEKIKLRNILIFYDNLKPLPFAEINRAFRELGITDEELSEEFGSLPAEEVLLPETPFAPAPAMPISQPKTLSRPTEKDQYLEPITQKPTPPSSQTTKPLPQTEKKTAGTFPQSPLRPQAPPLPPYFFKEEAKKPAPPKPQPQTPPIAPVKPAAPEQKTIPSWPTAPMRPPFQADSFPSQKYSFPSPPQPNLPKAQTEKSPYLEPIDEPLPPRPLQPPFRAPASPQPSSPAPKPLSKPEPRLDGNIVDLKNINHE